MTDRPNDHTDVIVDTSEDLRVLARQAKRGDIDLVAIALALDRLADELDTCRSASAVPAQWRAPKDRPLWGVMPEPWHWVDESTISDGDVRVERDGRELRMGRPDNQYEETVPLSVVERLTGCQLVPRIKCRLCEMGVPLAAPAQHAATADVAAAPCPFPTRHAVDRGTNDRRIRRCGCVLGYRFVCVTHCGGHPIPGFSTNQTDRPEFRLDGDPGTQEF